MFSGERASESNHKVRGLFHKGAIVADSFCALHVEVDARMQAAMAKVPVEGSDVVVFVEQVLELAQVLAHACGRDGGIFPPLPEMRFTRNEGRSPEARFAYLPDLLLLRGIFEEAYSGRSRATFHACDQRFRFPVRIAAIIGAELD